MSGSGTSVDLDTHGFGDPEEQAEGSSLILLLVGAATPLLVIMLATAVLFGIRLPARGTGIAQAAQPTVVISIQGAAPAADGYPICFASACAADPERSSSPSPAAQRRTSLRWKKFVMALLRSGRVTRGAS